MDPWPSHQQMRGSPKQRTTTGWLGHLSRFPTVGTPPAERAPQTSATRFHLSRIPQLDQRTALPDQCLHSAEADVRPPRRKSGFDPTRTYRVDARSCATGPARCHLRQSGSCDYRSQLRNKVLGSPLSRAGRSEGAVAEQRVQRRLAAILAADVVGYSALMQRAEEATYAEFERLKRELIEPSLSRHEGRREVKGAPRQH